MESLKRIVYVSRDPATGRGVYRVEGEVLPVDMFPQMWYVECGDKEKIESE